MWRRMTTKLLLRRIILVSVLRKIPPTVLSSPRECHHGSQHSRFIQREPDYFSEGNLLAKVSNQFRASLYHSLLIKDTFKLPFTLAHSMWHLSMHLVRKAQKVILSWAWGTKGCLEATHFVWPGKYLSTFLWGKIKQLVWNGSTKPMALNWCHW